MNHLGLFEGIGGFSLAAREVGWRTIAWVEINKYCQQVLTKNFPEAKGYGDIKEFDGTKYRGTIDIITGGFPCQPFSVAGKRRGKADDRHLWPEMLRVIREVRPAWVVGENVTGIIGLALEQMLTEMEAEGYHTETFIIPACSVGAPHRRDRVWIVAYSHSKSEQSQINEWQGIGQEGKQIWDKSSSVCANVSDTNGKGFQALRKHGGLQEKERETCTSFERRSMLGSERRSTWWDTEPGICRVANGIPNRTHRIKALGNAIVPQIAFEIFKAIKLCI